MSTVYRIREWDDRYEVNTGNSAWKPGQEKRRGPLSYIRMPVNGRSLTRPMMRLNALAGKNAPAVFGVFTKLMELAADNDPALRGQIIDSDGTPLEAKDIAEILCWPLSTIENALNVLSHNDLRWIEQTPVLGIPRISEEVQGKPISDQNTDQNTDDSCTEPVPGTVPASAPAEVFVKGRGPYQIDEAEVGMWFPVVGCKDPRGWPLTKSHAKQLRASFKAKFPNGDDMRLEFEKARSWAINNPRKRKTPDGMPSFLNHWIGKSR